MHEVYRAGVLLFKITERYVLGESLVKSELFSKLLLKVVFSRKEFTEAGTCWYDSY